VAGFTTAYSLLIRPPWLWSQCAVTADGGANWRLLPLPVAVSGAAAPPALLQLALPGGPIFLTGMDPAYHCLNTAPALLGSSECAALSGMCAFVPSVAGTLLGLAGAAFLHALVPGVHRSTVSNAIRGMARDMGGRAEEARETRMRDAGVWDVGL
jgi:hypothetical protein